MSTMFTLSQLGWRPFFQQQLSLEEWGEVLVARVMAQHRSGCLVATQHSTFNLIPTAEMDEMTVGDWVLLDSNKGFIRLLDRLSVFRRKAAGSKRKAQLTAANVDTVFVVCSLNDDFNLNRIERYLALVHEAGAEPVIVLSKRDCCDDPDVYIQQLRRLDSLLMVEAVNGLDRASVAVLESWCAVGKTLAFLGSSGVGKSTIINALLGGEFQRTHTIREDDSKGRHTTTGRVMQLMPSGALLLDTPGMRELHLVACEQGIESTFSDITLLAERCRFSDCQHQCEPGCAVLAEVELGSLETRRLENYHKLKREQAQSTASLAELRHRDRSVTKLHSSFQKNTQVRKKGR
ncbi:MAG: ribosome small subunit-dependent GTPase A [Spongiibacteraceae bacterium]|nr:ribosome small subunit-dependent GTPase A [Spongiibacteraceae bacterium]